MKGSLILLSILLLAECSMADIRMPGIFGDNMVLQRDRPIPVWGWADPGENISLQLDKQTLKTKADKSGKWLVRLMPEAAGGPFSLSIAGKNRIVFNNVLVGEVWLCSGQSNMEMPIAGWGKINNYQQEIQAADFPMIRHIKIPNTVSFTPKDDVAAAGWKICSPETAGDFTAVGYFFARELFNKLKVPIGLINSSWGGTMVETWTSRGAFEQSEEFRSMIASMTATDMESLARQRSESMIRKIESIQGPVEKNPQTETWKNADFDDSHWAHMKLPGLWESQGLDDLDGLVWFRKTIVISAEDAGRAAMLDLAMIDDSDDSYFNGTRVGGLKNQWNAERHYQIPAGILKAGRNTIAVRVEDTGGGGGIFGESGQMKLKIGSHEIDLAGDWQFRIESISPASSSVGPNSYPTLLFNAMINPLIPFGIRGAIWYQGEANAGRAYEYRKSFPLMIHDWRQHWNEGDFPFYFVQLASWNANNGNSEQGSTWAELREAQTLTLSLPNTGMAVTTDIGNPADIHPKNKQDVGKRLAAIALNNLYGQPMECSGPVYQSMKTEGQKIILSFTHTGQGLLVNDKYGYLKGFEIAGADLHFAYAKAYVQGNQVIVYRDDLPNPVHVRYNWADDAGDGNLFNKDGFPAISFRTDQKKGITEETKYAIGK